MKNINSIFLTFFISILFIGLAFFGCEKNSDNVQSYKLNSPQILEKFNAGKFDYKKGEYIKGKLSIRPIDETTLDFYLTTNDGRYIHYILQSEKSLDVEKVIENAEALFLRRLVVFNDLDTKETILASIDEESKLDEDIRTIPFDAKFNGFGLARQENNTSGVITSRANVNCQCCITGQTSNACTTLNNGECDAGGSGSTSCSLNLGGTGGSSSVECSTGNACCWDS
jgi:hypothetical protein